MILRRIADAIRRENWSSAVIEILIVVVGIIIGLQVDDWNTERKERAEVGLQVQRIGEDAEALLATIRGAIASLDRNIAALGVVQDVLEGADVTPENREQFILGLDRSYRLYPRDVSLEGMERLMASGDINKLRDESLRQSLLDFYNARRGGDSILAHVRSLLDIGSAVLLRYISYDIGAANPDEPGGVDFELTYRLEAMRNDPEVLAAAGNAARMIGFARGVFQDYVGYLEDIIEKADAGSNGDNT